MFAPGSLSLRPESRVTDRDRKRFMKVFESCDQGKKGYLTREDLKVAVVMLFGYKPSKLEVNSMMSSLQPANETTGVTLDVFVRMMSTKKAAQLSFGDHRQIFSAFDAHCCGFLTVEDFKRAFKHVSPIYPNKPSLKLSETEQIAIEMNWYNRKEVTQLCKFWTTSDLILQNIRP